jgi:hypothetical protein
MMMMIVTMFLIIFHVASVTAFVVDHSYITTPNALNVRSIIRMKHQQQQHQHQVVEKTTRSWTKNNWNNSFSSTTALSSSSSSSSVENNINDDNNESNGSKDDDNEDFDEMSLISSLQNTICSIEALEERNTAQIESFIDEKDQWESLELYEQELLSSKEEILKQLSELT